MRFLVLLAVFIWILMVLRSILKAAVQFLLSGVSAQRASPASERPADETHRLVRDPECGIYIRQDRALPMASGGETVHFCSPACRDRYFARQQKLAASA